MSECYLAAEPKKIVSLVFTKILPTIGLLMNYNAKGYELKKNRFTTVQTY